ncbi:FadR/GntR family transcriptional regulator [Streptomyces sp. SID3343]|uniref:FadR/GntR family transcriptional regulator n=1 Tax=Streptomyces sp. SID3343 TaxID=2690260 RepID=UPI00136E1FFF|nr:FadR/GntR family transcriptional regulator [Streptomyces sp. SID3343]MYW02832.1 FCD domain-containing protein [Streptomyces sp. SID3343]
MSDTGVSWNDANNPEQLRRSTLADRMAEQIIERIMTLGLRPGDEVPSEGELARQFGANRLAVREAIRTLVAREILVSSQGRPARVTVPSSRVFGQMLEFRLRQQSLDLDNLVDTRRVIEGELVRRAAQRVAAGEVDAAPARALLEEMAGRQHDRDRFVELDVAFHHAIAELAGNRMLTLILESLEGVLLESRRASFEGRTRAGLSQGRALLAHARILDAIVGGDPDAAAGAMAEHLSDTIQDLRAP